MSDSITDLRPVRGIKLYKKRFQISVTRSDFQGALTAITRDLSDEQEEVNYRINFYDQTGDDFGIIKWWRSKLDPERFHETLIVGFSHIARGPMLLQVEAQILQRIGIRAAEEETAWRILRELGSRFPECGLDSPVATSEIPKSDDAAPDQAGELRSIYEELPIPDTGKMTPADWAAIFDYLKQRGVLKFEYAEIARLTGKTPGTVEKNASYYRNDSYPKSYRKSKES